MAGPYNFHQVLVSDIGPGGSVRTLRNGKVTVRSATGIAPADAGTGAVIYNLTSDSSGTVTFTTGSTPVVDLVAPSGFVKRVTSPDLYVEAQGAATSAASAASSAAASATSASNAAALVGAPAKSAMDAAMGGDVAGLVPTVNGKVGKNTAFISADDNGLATGNTGAANVTALQAALDAAVSFGVSEVRITKSGTYNFASSITMRPGVTLRGLAKVATLNFTGTGSFLVQATPGTRAYNFALSNLVLQGPGAATATVGVDLDSVSTSRFDDVISSGFGKAWRIGSAINGGAVYNTFINCNGSNSGTGFSIEASGTNATRFFACRANGCTTGLSIVDSNNTTWLGGQIEVNTLGVKIDATGAGLSDSNLIHGTRFENNTTAWNVASSNVRYAQIIQPEVFGTYATSDSGTATTAWGGAARSYTASPVQDALGAWRWTRTANGGAETPAVVFADSNNASGTPVTVQVETERGGGYFFRGKRAGTTYFDIGSSAGDIRWSTDLTIGRQAAGVLKIAGATTGTTAPAAGAAGALPATPAGYLTVNINGTARQIPYY